MRPLAPWSRSRCSRPPSPFLPAPKTAPTRRRSGPRSCNELKTSTPTSTDKVCDLFETDVVADIREMDAPQTVDLVCVRLKRAVGSQTRSYSYSPDIKEILVFGDAAVVRPRLDAHHFRRAPRAM